MNGKIRLVEDIIYRWEFKDKKWEYIGEKEFKTTERGLATPTPYDWLEVEIANEESIRYYCKNVDEGFIEYITNEGERVRLYANRMKHKPGIDMSGLLGDYVLGPQMLTNNTADSSKMLWILAKGGMEELIESSIPEEAEMFERVDENDLPF